MDEDKSDLHTVQVREIRDIREVPTNKLLDQDPTIYIYISLDQTQCQNHVIPQITRSDQNKDRSRKKRMNGSLYQVDENSKTFPHV